MAPRSCSPRSHSVVCANEIIARENSIVAVGSASNEMAVDKSATIATPVMCAKRI